MFRKEQKSETACAMSVAGSDSGAGAGIQADLLTFAAHGIYGCTAITALTAQNPDRVSAVYGANPDFLTAQLEAVETFYKPKSAKTGMLFDSAIVENVADFFAKHKEISLVVDPVMISTSGSRLLRDDAVEALEKRLIPVSALFTPNLDEGAALLGAEKIGDIEAAALSLLEKFGVPVLLKGGHLEGDDIVDILATADGKTVSIKSKRVKGVNTHGSGCTLSAAITANLAKGLTLEQSCLKAQAYILACMKNPLKISGEKFLNHFSSI